MVEELQGQLAHHDPAAFVTSTFATVLHNREDALLCIVMPRVLNVYIGRSSGTYQPNLMQTCPCFWITTIVSFTFKWAFTSFQKHVDDLPFD